MIKYQRTACYSRSGMLFNVFLRRKFVPMENGWETLLELRHPEYFYFRDAFNFYRVKRGSVLQHKQRLEKWSVYETAMNYC